MDGRIFMREKDPSQFQPNKGDGNLSKTENPSPGLSDFLLGKVSFDAIIKDLGASNLFISRGASNVKFDQFNRGAINIYNLLLDSIAEIGSLVNVFNYNVVFSQLLNQILNQESCCICILDNTIEKINIDKMESALSRKTGVPPLLFRVAAKA